MLLWCREDFFTVDNNPRCRIWSHVLNVQQCFVHAWIHFYYASVIIGDEIVGTNTLSLLSSWYEMVTKTDLKLFLSVTEKEAQEWFPKFGCFSEFKCQTCLYNFWFICLKWLIVKTFISWLVQSNKICSLRIRRPFWRLNLSQAYKKGTLRFRFFFLLSHL